MARSKKTRKVGPIGVPKAQKTNTSSTPAAPTRSKKKKGNPAGSRHSQPQQTSTQVTNKGHSDPRHGSKKAVPLVVKAPAKTSTAEKFFSPRHELKAIENDSRLYRLIDLLDEGKSIKEEDQQYVDHKLERHRILCELLGIETEEAPDDEQQDPTEDDLLDKLDNASLSSFKQ